MTKRILKQITLATGLMMGATVVSLADEANPYQAMAIQMQMFAQQIQNQTIAVKTPSALQGQGSVALNPQPEPPGKQVVNSGWVGLNPQPEPPSAQSGQGSVALNPQPEPPGVKSEFNARTGWTGLNPQPDPPSRPAYVQVGR